MAEYTFGTCAHLSNTIFCSSKLGLMFCSRYQWRERTREHSSVRAVGFKGVVTKFEMELTLVSVETY
jgi:hypothetical protein